MNAAGVAVAWIGSVLGPLFVLSTFGDFSHPNTYIGTALTHYIDTHYDF